MSQPYKSGRQKNLNLGISSVTENDTILQVTGKVGIGTTSAYDRSLYVIGPGEITGITSLASSGGITTTGGDLYVGRDAYVKRNFVISGITTFQSDVDIDGSLNVDTNLTVTGLSTFTGITTNQSTIFGRQLSISGVSTFVGITTNQSTIFANNLSVAGLSTFVGITTNQSTIFGTQLSVVGPSTFIGVTTNNSTIFGTQLSVVGPSTFIGITTNNSTIFGTQLSVSGVSTFIGLTTNTSTIFARDLSVAGLSTFVGITTNQSTIFGKQLNIAGVSTFVGLVDANGGAEIDNIRIGIADDNEIDTSVGNLVIDSAGGTVTIDDQLVVTGVSTFNNNVDIDKSLNVDGNVTVTGLSTFTGISTNQSTIFATQLSVSGVSTFNNNVRLPDNKTLSLGDSDDLQLIHDGSNSYIKDTGTGSLILTTNKLEVKNAANTETGIIFNEDGPVELYYDNNKRLETTGIGISLTAVADGTATITGPSTIIVDPAGIGDNTGAVRIKGDLYVDGTQFIVNSSVIELADLRVGIATTVGTNLLLDGGGIGIGSTNILKTFTYNFSSDSLKSSENIDLAIGKVYKINGTEVLSAAQLTVPNIYATGVTTIGIASLSQLFVTGVSTFTGLVDANGGATIDNIQIGITDDNEIDTSVGNLVIDSAGGTVTVDDQLVVTGISTFNNNVDIDKSLNVDGNVTVTGLSTFTNTIDANNGATIDNIRIGIADDNEIDTSVGNLVVDSAGGTVTIDDQLVVTGVSTFNNTVDIDKSLNVDGNVTVTGLSTFTGITTNQSTIFGRQLSVAGVSTFVGITTSQSTIFGTQLSVVGPSTFVGIVTNESTIFGRQLSITGVSTFHNGPVLIGSGSSTGTINQKLQVTGGAYISTYVGIGFTDPFSDLAIYNSGGAWISLVDPGASSAAIENDSGTLYIRAEQGSGDSEIVFQTGTSNYEQKPSVSGSNRVRINKNGVLLVNTDSASGVSQQNLQVTGGAYISGNTGIGLSNATSRLHVQGDVLVTGVVTAKTFNGNINAGVSTLGFATATTLYVAGVSTFVGVGTFSNDLYVGGDLYVRDDLVLDEIRANQINITGVSTLGVASATSLFVTGVSTFVGVGTFNNDLYVGGDLYVRDDLVLDEVTVNQINVTGVSTLGIASASTLFVTGVSTFVGVTTNRSTIFGNQLSIAGVSTFVGITTSQSTIFGTQLSVAGVSTFVGVGTFNNDLYVGGDLYVRDDLVLDEIRANQINITGVSTLGVASATSLFVTGVSTFVGITTSQSTIFARQLSVSGVTTHYNDVRLNDGNTLYFGTDNDMRIFHDGGAAYIDNDTGILYHRSGQHFFENANGTETFASFVGDGAVSLYYDNSKKLETTGYGITVYDTIQAPQLNITGFGTIKNFVVPAGGEFDVYDTTATFHNNLFVAGNLSIGGTATVITTQDLRVFDRDIILGIATDAFGNDITTDISANHGGIAIASTEGSPLVNLSLVGFSSIPSTYKQLMWIAANSYGVGTTDAWMFNYAVGIGSTLVPNGVRFAVKGIQFTDDTISAPNLNLSNNLRVIGLSTFTGITTNQSTLFGNQLSISGVSTFIGIVTNTSTIFANQLSVSGVTTLAAAGGITTTGGDVYVGGDLYVKDDLVIDELTARNINVTGLTTVGVVSAISVNATGIITASSFRPSTGFYQSADGTNGFFVYNGTGNVAFQGTIGASSINNAQGYQAINFTTNSTPTVLIPNDLNVTGLTTLASAGGITTTGGDVYVGGDLYVKDDLVLDEIRASQINITGVSTLGVASATSLFITGVSTFVGVTTNRSTLFGNQLSIAGLSTFVGFSTFQNNVSIAGTLDVNGNINFNGNLFQNNAPFIASRWRATTAGSANTEGGDIYRLSNVGIGTSTLLGALTVRGDANVSGVVTATTFTGNVIAGVATLGIATAQTLEVFTSTRLRGQIRDAFNDAGTSLYVLASGGPTGNWSWQPVTSTGAGTLNGISVREEGGTVGTALSITALDFIGGNITATADPQPNGIATIRVSDTPNFDSINITGLSTFVGVATSKSTFFAKDLSVVGLSTFIGISTFQSTLFGTQASFTGVTTSNGVYIGATQVISSARQLQNIASLDAVTTATIEAAIQNAPNTFVDLQVTGLSTFVGVATFQSGLFGTNASFTGIVTAGTFIGQVNAGVATITNLFGTNATFTGNVSIGGTLTYEDVTNIDSIGVVTARSDVIVGGGLSVTGITTLASAGGITTTGGALFVGAGLTVKNDINFYGNLYRNGQLFSSGIGIGSTSVNPQSGIITPSARIGIGFTDINFVGTGISITGYGSTVVIDLGNINAATGGANVSISSTPPGISTSSGDMWWDSENGDLKIYYVDANSAQWIDANGGSQSLAIISETAPSGYGVTSSGTLWWDSTYGVLKVYYGDGDSNQWVDANSGAYINYWVGNYGGTGIHTTANVGVGTTVATEKLQVNGYISIDGNVSYGTTTATTTSTAAVGIHSTLATSTYRSVEYTIQATQGTNFHTTKILALHDGTTAYHTEYGSIFNNVGVSTYNVDVSGGNIRLLATPTSASTTNFKVTFNGIKV